VIPEKQIVANQIIIIYQLFFDSIILPYHILQPKYEVMGIGGN